MWWFWHVGQVGSEACLHYIKISSIATKLHSKVVLRVNSIVYIFVSMTLITKHVRGEGSYNCTMTFLKLGRCVCVRYLRMCAKFHSSMVNSCRENSFGGVSILVHLNFSTKLHLGFQKFKFCFSTSMFPIVFLCLLMTGASIADSVFLPKNIFIEHGCQFHYWSLPSIVVVFLRSPYSSSCLSVLSCVLSLLQ